jgi:hypothetical protein
MYKGIFLSFKVDNDSQLNWSSTAKRVEKDGQSKFQLSNHSERKKTKRYASIGSSGIESLTSYHALHLRA